LDFKRCVEGEREVCRGEKGFHGEAWRYGVTRRKKYRFRGEGVERKRGSAE